MKRRRSNRWRTCALAAAIPVLLSTTSQAQDDVSVEGAVFLLRPVGARAVGIGQAVVARRDGSESIWWNPAALAAVTRREVAIHHSQDFFATGDALVLIIPSRLLGVLGITADIQDYGEQENTVGPEPPTGTILSRSFVLSATYATTIGSQVRSGVGFKVVQLRFDCTGPCDLPTSVAQTVALDAGVQVDVGRSRRLTVGASVRNVGVPLQVEDRPQADPLPSRLQLGAAFSYPLPERYADDAELKLSADVFDDLDFDSPLPRVGAEFIWQRRAFLRGGYVFESSRSEAGGPSLGLGLVSGSVSIDIARVFTGFSADAGQAPTFLSLRIQF
jgi:hypothetical protein